MSSLLMRYMHAIFGRPSLAFDDSGRGRPSAEGGTALCWGNSFKFTWTTSLFSPRRRKST
jgi:hypothetical protein